MNWNAAGWVCTAGAGLCAAGALAGAGRFLELSLGDHTEVCLAQGVFGVVRMTNLNVMLGRRRPVGFTVEHHDVNIQWWPEFQPSWAPPGGGDMFITVPLWMPMVGCGVGALMCRRRARTLAARVGQACPSCGYPTTGRPAGDRCPECGSSPAA